MKYLVSIIVLFCMISSCEQSHNSHNKEQNQDDLIKTNEKKEGIESGSATKFPVVGFRKVHEEIIPFPIEKVFPLFEPEGRPLLYENWKPTVLREGKEGSLKGRIEFSKYDMLDVFLKVTEYNPEKGHIQYLAIWDDFEIQRIDIFCSSGEEKNTTNLKWVEHNAGLYEKGVSLVSMFVEEGHLVKAVERYANNVENYLNQEEK